MRGERCDTGFARPGHMPWLSGIRQGSWCKITVDNNDAVHGIPFAMSWTKSMGVEAVTKDIKYEN